MNKNLITKKQPDLSVVVLCYKSENLALRFYTKLVKSLKKVVPNYEVVLVGNYNSTTDLTPSIVKKIAAKDKRVVAVVKKKQGMMGWDMRSGLSAATGRYVAIIDGDDQFKPELVLKVFKKITTQQLDFVKTKRIRRDDGLYRSLISFWFNFFFDVLFDAKYFTDVNSKPKIMKRELLKKMNLVDNGWFIDAEIMLEVKRLTKDIGEVPVRFHENKYRKSFVGNDAIIEMLTKLIKYKLKESQHAFNNWWNWLYWPKTTSTPA